MSTKQVVGSADPIPVVILNWNGEKDTIECLESIRQSVPSGFVPVLVDNASAPESVEVLERECCRIFGHVLFLQEQELSTRDVSRAAELREYLDENSLIFLKSSENLGFAKGSNLGVKVAEAIGAEWVMLLNNDTVVSPDAFQQLRNFRDEHREFLAITPQIREYKRMTRILNCGGELTYFGSLRYKFAGLEASEIPQVVFSRISFITGCALLFKYKSTGVLTEDFFFGEEDYEFSLRMRKSGAPMSCLHGAVIHHKVGTTISRSSKRLGQILVYYVNRLINTRNYYSTLRWQTTRILAYLYLPLLFVKSGVDPRRSFSAVRRVESFITRHRGVTRTDFQSLILSNR